MSSFDMKNKSEVSNMFCKDLIEFAFQECKVHALGPKVWITNRLDSYELVMLTA